MRNMLVLVEYILLGLLYGEVHAKPVIKSCIYEGNVYNVNGLIVDNQCYLVYCSDGHLKSILKPSCIPRNNGPIRNKRQVIHRSTPPVKTTTTTTLSPDSLGCRVGNRWFASNEIVKEGPCTITYCYHGALSVVRKNTCTTSPMTTTTTLPPHPPGACFYGGKWYPSGTTIHKDRCSSIICSTGQIIIGDTWECIHGRTPSTIPTVTTTPPTSLPPTKPPAKATTIPPKTVPPTQPPTTAPPTTPPGSCFFNNKWYPSGATVAKDWCSTAVCNHGSITYYDTWECIHGRTTPPTTTPPTTVPRTTIPPTTVPTTQPPTTTPPTTPPGSCFFNNKWYPSGATVAKDWCSTAVCNHGSITYYDTWECIHGRTTTPTTTPPTTVPRTTIPPTTVPPTEPPTTTPPTTPPGSCFFNNKWYPSGATVAKDWCSTAVCNHGSITYYDTWECIHGRTTTPTTTPPTTVPQTTIPPTTVPPTEPPTTTPPTTPPGSCFFNNRWYPSGATVAKDWCSTAVCNHGSITYYDTWECIHGRTTPPTTTPPTTVPQTFIPPSKLPAKTTLPPTSATTRAPGSCFINGRWYHENAVVRNSHCSTAICQHGSVIYYDSFECLFGRTTTTPPSTTTPPVNPPDFGL